MQNINSLASRIIADHRDIGFVLDNGFYWRPDDRTIHHAAITTQEDVTLLLHEIGHARLNHTDYSSDVGLLDMEREAWSYALTELAPQYSLDLSAATEVAEDALDSYRDWLHKRSTCPSCEAVGVESLHRGAYRCIVCAQGWRVNEARSCQLRRYTT